MTMVLVGLLVLLLLGISGGVGSTLAAGGCDETVQDGESIQAAVDGTSAGDTICVEHGTYNEEVEIETNHTSLVASEGASPVLSGESTLDNGITIRGTGVSVEGFEITEYSRRGIWVIGDETAIRNNTIVANSDGIGSGVTDLTVDGNYISHNDEIGIRAGGTNLVISNNELTNNGQKAVRITGSENVTLSGNTITENVGYDWSTIVVIDESREVSIVDNTIVDNEYRAVHLGTDWIEGVVVEGNTIENNSDRAISVGSHPANPVVDMEIINNSIGSHGAYGSTGFGITTVYTEDLVIRDNDLSDDRMSLSRTDNASIEHNSVSGEGYLSLASVNESVVRSNELSNGIIISAGTTHLRGPLIEEHYLHEIENNTIQGEPIQYVREEDDPEIDPDAGQVIVANSSNVSISGFEFSSPQIGFSEDVEFTDNTFTEEDGPLAGTLNLWGVEGAIVDGNEGNQIQITRGKDISATNNTLTDSAGLTFRGVGIDVDGVGNVNAENNHISGHDWGIWLNRDQDNITATGNEITDNEWGIHVGRDANGTFRENVITGNDEWGVYAANAIHVDARWNWWGAENGPSGEGDGDGDPVSENVMFDPWLGDEPDEPDETDDPTATFTHDPNEPEVSKEVTFDASDSTSPNGDIVEYRWDFSGDGTVDETTTDPVTTHTYDEAGNYDVTLTVEDAVDATGSTSESLTVFDPDVHLIDDCTVIDEPGSYTFVEDLSTDQTGDGATCIEITASDVDLVGQGHAVTGGEPIDWRGSNYGIRVTGATNVTVADVEIHDWDELGSGLFVEDSTDVTVRGAHAANNTFGIRTNGVEGFLLEDSQSADNERAGIQLNDLTVGEARNVTSLRDAHVDGWTGIYVRGDSSDVLLENATARDTKNEGNGIRVMSSTSAITLNDAVAMGADGTGVVVGSDDAVVDGVTARDNDWDFSAESTVAVADLTVGVDVEVTLSFEATHVRLRSNETAPANPDADSLGLYFDADAIEDDAVLEASLQYTDDDVSTTDEESLSLWRYDDGAWTEIESTVDTEANTVDATITEFSTFGVFAETAELASFEVQPVSDPVLQGDPLEIEFVNAVDVHGEPYTTGDDSWTNIDVEHPLDDQPRRVAVEFVDGEAHATFEVLDGEETEDLDVGTYSNLEAWDVNDPSISDTYNVEIIATRLASFDVQPVTDPVLQGDPLEVEFVNAVDVHGEPYTTGDDSWTNIDVEHPLDDQPRRVAVEFVDGEATTTFEVLDGEETEDLDVGTYSNLEAWDVNDPSISDTYDVEIVAIRLASFEVRPVTDPVLQDDTLEVEFVNAVDVDGEPYTTGDDTWTNIDVEHPLDDQPRRVAVEFVDGEAHATFEVLDGQETEDLALGEYSGLEAWEVNDPRINDTYDVEIVATRLAEFEVQPVTDPVLQGEPLEVEFVNAVDVDGEPYTTGDDTWTNIDVEHPLDDQPRRVAVEFVDGEAHATFEVLDGEETEDLELDTYDGLEAWDVNDPRISDTYDVEIVATRLASFNVQPVTDPVLQGDPLVVEFFNAVDVDGEPYTTGDDTWTNIDVEHPLDDQPRRVAVEFVDGEAHATFEVLDGQETEELALEEYSGLEAWDVTDPRISDGYDVEIVATRLASFDVQPVTDPVIQGDPLEVEFVNAVDVDGEPYTTGDDSWTNIDVEHPLDDQPRRVAVEFVDGEAHATFEVLDTEETEDLEVGEYTDLEAWEVTDPSIRSTYDVEIVATEDESDLPFLDADGSGFGGVLAVIALLGAAGIVRRRLE